MSSSTEQITHRNHYVPEFYLRNWSEDGNTIYVYSLLVSDKRIPYWSKNSIRSTAVWNDFYTRTEGEKEVDDFEKWFNSEFETPVQSVFSKLTSARAINEDESKRLTRYIMAQHLRTPAGLNLILDLHKRIMPDVMEKCLQALNRSISSNTIRKRTTVQMPEGAELQPFKVTINRDENLIEAKALVGRGSYLYSLKYLLTETVKKVENYKWHVIHAANGVQFPTSDDPVICLDFNNESNYHFYGGWGKSYGNIILPVSPTILLFTEINSKASPEQLDYSPKWSAFFRRLIIQHAHRYVYAYTKQKGMLEINPRRVNQALYDKEKQEMTGWYEEQTLHEKEYE